MPDRTVFSLDLLDEFLLLFQLYGRRDGPEDGGDDTACPEDQGPGAAASGRLVDDQEKDRCSDDSEQADLAQAHSTADYALVLGTDEQVVAHVGGHSPRADAEVPWVRLDGPAIAAVDHAW